MKDALNYVAENYLPYVAAVMAILLICYAAKVLWGKNKDEQNRWDRIIEMKKKQEQAKK